MEFRLLCLNLIELEVGFQNLCKKICANFVQYDQWEIHTTIYLGVHGRYGLWTVVCIQWSSDLCEGLTSVLQQTVWIHLIQVYCWDYVQLVKYQSTARLVCV